MSPKKGNDSIGDRNLPWPLPDHPIPSTASSAMLAFTEHQGLTSSNSSPSSRDGLMPDANAAHQLLDGIMGQGFSTSSHEYAVGDGDLSPIPASQTLRHMLVATSKAAAMNPGHPVRVNFMHCRAGYHRSSVAVAIAALTSITEPDSHTEPDPEADPREAVIEPHPNMESSPIIEPPNNIDEVD